MADLDTSSQQFNEIEKRNAAFKFVFGILQLDSFKKISQEKMSTGFQVFSSEILGGNVKSALNTNNINQARIRTWVTESGNYTGEGAIWSGSFSSSNESTTDNPNVEKIVLPLLKIQSTHNQSYVAYLNSGSTYEDISFNSTFNSHDITVGAKLILSSSNRVTDFISPFKFGSAYNVSLNPSNNTYTGPNTDIEIGQDTSQETTNKSYGGWVFDYKNGTLYVAVDPSGDEPLISDFKHPLWLTGYRYIGSTGSIATATTSSHAVSALSSSHAVTASFALNAGGGVGVGFPFSGSAVITGSLLISGSSTNEPLLHVSGGTISASFIHATTGSFSRFESVSTKTINHQTVFSQSIFSGSTIFGAPSGTQDPSTFVHRFTGSIELSGSGEMRIPSVSFDFMSGSHLEFTTFSASAGFIDTVTVRAQKALAHITASIITGSLTISGSANDEPLLDVHGKGLFRTSPGATPFFEIDGTTGDGDLEIAGTLTANRLLTTNPISIDGGLTISGSVGTYTDGDGNTRTIGLKVDNDISASGFVGEFFEISSSTVFRSSSTEFGDSLDDTHTFTGSVFITASKVDISSSTLTHNGNNVLVAGTGTVDIIDDTNLVAGNDLIFASKTLNIADNFLRTDGDDSTSHTLTVAGLESTTHITASNNISSSGIVFASAVEADNYLANPTTLNQLDEDSIDSGSNQDKIIVWDESVDAWKYITVDDLQDAIDTNTAGSTTFLGMTDTPSNYNTMQNKILSVNSNADAIEFIDNQASGFPFSGSAVITGSLIVSGGTSYSFGGFLISESVNNSGNVDTELRRTIPVTGQNGTGSLIFSSVGQDGNIVPLLQFEDKGGTILGSTRGGLKIESQGGVGGVGSAVIRNSIDHHNLELKHVGSGSLILRASGDNANLVFSNGSVSGESQGLNIISGSLTGFSSTDVTIRNSVVHPMPLLYKFGHSANNAELIMFKAGGVASTTIRTSGTSEFDGDISATGTLTLGTTTFTETDLASVVASSDNLGHHTASLDLNMSNNDIVNVKSIKVNNIEASASNTITIADNLSPAGNIISTGISSTLSYRFGVFTDSLDVGTEGGTPRLLRVHGRISASAVTSSEINIGGATFTSASLASGGGGGVSNYSDLSGIPSGIFSSSLQPFTNITASGNISASGDLFVNDITMDGTAGDPSQLIGKKAGTERFRIETKGGGSNSALMWLDDGSGNRGIYLDGSDNPNFIKGNLQLGKNFDYPFTPPEKLTVEGNISASGNVSANTITAGKYITLKPSSNSGKVHITGSLTVSGSSTFTNLGTFVNTGSILNLGDTTTQGTFTSAGKTILKAGVGTPDGRLNGTLVVNAKIHESDFRTNIAEFGINGTPQYAFQRVRNGGIFPVNTNIPTGMGNVHFPYRPDNSGNILTDVAGKPVPDGGFNIFNAVAGSPLTSSAHMVFWNVYSSSAGVVSESIGVIGYGGNSPVFGFGTTEPSASFHITASLTGSQTDLIRVQNDIGVPVFKMKPDGRFIMRNSGSSVNEVTMSVDSANNFVVNDTFKVNHKDVIFKSGSQEVSAKVDPSTGQINFEAPDGSKVGFKGNETTRTTSDGKVVKKVVQDGKEFTRSGSATENQIEFQQNPNGAFITVSGSTPGFNVIKSGTTNEFQIIRQTYNTMYAGGEVYTYGMDSTDKMWFINNSILAAASDSSLFRMSSSGDLFIKRNIELDGGINGISGSTIFTPNQINMITGVSGSGGTISAHHITASGNISASHSSGTTPTHFIGGHVQIGDGVRGNLHIKGGGQKAGIYRDTERRIEMINGGPNNFYGSSGENSFYCTDTSVVSGQDYISLKFYNDDSNVLNSAIYIQATQDHNEESAAGSKFLFNAFSNTDDPTEDLNHNSSQTYNLLTIDPNATAGTLNVKGDISSSGAINTLSHITASGNISSSGTIIGSNISGTNTGDQSLVHLAVTASDVTFNNITASGDIKLADGKKLIVDNGDFIQWSDANKFAIGGLKLADDYGQLTFNAGNASNYVMQLWNSGSYEAVGIGGNFSTPPPSTLTVEGSISGSGNLDVDGNVSVDGVLTATRKSFLIPHPTDEGKQLQYASLEGPENGVYIRGKLKGDDIIELPHYWTELIDKDSITVSLTPIGNFQYLYVRDISTKQIMVGINDKPTRRIYCHYVVYAERKDIDKLEVEI